MTFSPSSLLRSLAFTTMGLLCSFSFHAKAHAYPGLGPLVPMIGSGIILIFAFLTTVLGLIVYPIKRILGKLRKNNVKSEEIPKQ